MGYGGPNPLSATCKVGALPAVLSLWLQFSVFKNKFVDFILVTKIRCNYYRNCLCFFGPHTAELKATPGSMLWITWAVTWCQGMNWGQLCEDKCLKLHNVFSTTVEYFSPKSIKTQWKISSPVFLDLYPTGDPSVLTLCPCLLSAPSLPQWPPNVYDCYPWPTEMS